MTKRQKASFQYPLFIIMGVFIVLLAAVIGFLIYPQLQRQAIIVFTATPTATGSIATQTETLQSTPTKKPLELLSTAGEEFLKHYEGNAFLTPTNDFLAGVCMIGFSHVLHTGECDRDDLDDKPIKPEKAQEIFTADLETFSQFILPYKDKIDQCQWDALMSLIYNIGGDQFNSSLVKKDLDDDNLEAVPFDMQRHSYSGGKLLLGLQKRREAEGIVFTSCMYILR